MGSSSSTPSEMDDPKTYRSALQASPSPSPTPPTASNTEEEGAPALRKAKRRRSHNPSQPLYPSSSDHEQDANDDQLQSSDSDTPPATPTTFAAQARDISNNSPSNDHRRLSSLCLDIRDAAETRGTNGDIRSACKWLLNREGVPQRLRGILWEQLLRGRKEDGEGEGSSGEDGDDECSDEECGSLDGGIVDGVKRARVMGVWRRTSADPEVVGRLCRAALERAEESNDAGLQMFRGEMVGLTATVSPPTRGVPLLPTPEEDVEMEDVAIENGVVEERFDAFVAKELGRKHDMLKQLRAMAMEGPTFDTFDPMCTCAAKCHCIYGASERRISRPAANGLTIRAGAAGLAPTDGLSPASGPNERSLGWYDRKVSFKGKMPEGKRDSIRPKGDDMAKGSDETSPRSSPDAQSKEGLQRESEAITSSHSPAYKR